MGDTTRQRTEAREPNGDATALATLRAQMAAREAEAAALRVERRTGRDTPPDIWGPPAGSRRGRRGRLQGRGLVAGAGALATAALAKLAGPQRVQAGHDTTTTYAAAQVLHLGQVNDGGNAASDESATSLTANTALVASVA